MYPVAAVQEAVLLLKSGVSLGIPHVTGSSFHPNERWLRLGGKVLAGFGITNDWDAAQRRHL